MSKIIKKEETMEKYGTLENNGGIKINTKRVVGYCRVSTDSDEQKDSLENQKAHFDYLAKTNPDWQLVNVYYDDGISGGSTKKRTGFNTMINDACNGKFDIIIVKNLSRFSRNTFDTLKYVKILLENNVAVHFEEDHIETELMASKMLLTFLSAISEQELLNTSSHVKQTFKNKMKEDRLVGGHRCLGYECNIKENTMTIIPKEAKTVKYIFKRYLEGAGCYTIAKELTKKGKKTIRGNTKWCESVIRDVLRNETYVGDVIQGKSMTVDPLTKRRLKNRGQQDMYKIENHHEAIIDKGDFERVQQIMDERSKTLKGKNTGQFDEKTRRLNTKMYAFSSVIECGFCGDLYTHRILHAGKPSQKEAWACCTAYKDGRKYCKDSKTIDQEVIEKAFVEAFNIFTNGDADVIDDYIKMAKKALNVNDDEKQLKELKKRRDKANSDNEKLLELALSDTPFNKKTLDTKVQENNNIILECDNEIEKLNQKLEDSKSISERLQDFKEVISTHHQLDEFDKDIFLATIEKIIIGRVDENGVKQPYDIMFIFKTGNEIIKDGKLYKPKRHTKKMCTKQSVDACRNCRKNE